MPKACSKCFSLPALFGLSVLFLEVRLSVVSVAPPFHINVSDKPSWLKLVEDYTKPKCYPQLATSALFLQLECLKLRPAIGIWNVE